MTGSPPPMRGKDEGQRRRAARVGITPAHAGKSRLVGQAVHRDRDHPRPCGEKMITIACKANPIGSPPPMRGKVGLPLRIPAVRGITPAHAGKSSPSFFFSWGGEDHPRPCGEKGKIKSKIILNVGSPPPMRGKVKLNCDRVSSLGITPAHAGKS